MSKLFEGIGTNFPEKVCIIRGCYRTDYHPHMINRKDADMDINPSDPVIRTSIPGLASDNQLPKPERVVHPPHYGGDTVYEVIKVIIAWKLDPCSANALKYIARAGKKDPDADVEDIEKAIQYLKFRVMELKGELP